MILTEGQRIIKHIAIIEEPGSKYFNNLIIQPPVSAANIVKSILACLEAHSVNLKCIKAIGCDGTNTNTSWKGGVIRLMEVEIGKPVQWLICMLHDNG